MDRGGVMMRWMMGRRSLGVLALLFGLLLVLVTLSLHSAQAAPGDLDSTFGVGGKVTTDFGLNDSASALVLQPDGKLVAAGSSCTITSGWRAPCNFALARYNPDGSLDSTFGVGGKVTTDFGTGHYLHALVRQPDGKLVVTGSAFIPLVPGGDWGS
jgi:uncharacterized delta-60 repeat protein